MWATQLRNYRNPSDKSSRIASKGAISASDKSSQQSQSDADSTAAGVNSSENQSQTSNKNLDKCAQLLSDMLRQDPGHKMRQGKEPKAAKVVPTISNARRVGKANIVMKTKRINDRGSKPAAAKKHVTIKTTRSGRRENAIDSVSETSTELQVRLTGPKPVPLNNSETVIQVTGKEPEQVPKLNTGQVIMTNVPYNDHIISSTPMSSPNAKSLHSNHSQHHHSNHSQLYGNQGYFHGNHMPQASQVLPGPQVGYSLHSSIKSDHGGARSIPQQQLNEPRLRPAENPETLAAMKDYITSSDDHLSSFLQNYLAQVPHPANQPTTAVPSQGTAPGSRVLSEISKQRQFLGQAQYPNPIAVESNYGASGPAYGAASSKSQGAPISHPVAGVGMHSYDTVQQNLNQNPNSGSRGSANANPQVQQIPYSKPNPTSDVDIDAILRSHGIVLQTGLVGGVSSSAIPPTDRHSEARPTRLMPGSSVDIPAGQNLGGFESHGPSPHTQSGDSQIPHLSTASNPATFPITTTTYPEAFTTIPERDINFGEDPSNKENQSTEDHPNEFEPKTPRTNKKSSKSSKKNKKTLSPNKGAVSKASPADVKTQVRTLLYLFGELRAVTSLRKDLEVERLLGDMESVLKEVTPGMANSGLSTDLDLALQPLRSENAQLRRRIRILTQQFKEKCQAAEDACKPDPNFQVIHLELQRHSLETQLKEESEAKEKLQAAISSLAQQVQGLMKERQNMLQLLNVKDTDHMKSQQDWVGEAGKLRIQLKTAEQNMKERQGKLDAANNEVTLLDVTLKQKNKEIDRLRDLVKDLQGSMSRLLEDLKENKPRSLPAVDDISHYIQNIDTLLRPEKARESHAQPMREASAPDSKKTDSAPPAPLQELKQSLIDPSPYTSPLQQLVNAIPDLPTVREDDVEGGLERAYRLLDRIDAAISPEVVQGSQLQSHSTPEQRSMSPQRAKAARQAWRETEEQIIQDPQWKTQDEAEGRRRRSSSPRKGIKVRLTGFDPENDNYQGKLTQELLMEHDRQNGVDNEVIERMLTRSTHSQRPGEHSGATAKRYPHEGGKSMQKNDAQHQHSRKSADKVDSSNTQGKSRFKGTQPRVGSDSDYDKQSGLTGILSPGDLDTTEYLNPPAQKEGRTANTGPTVKELLAPLANRMMNTTGSKRVNAYDVATSDLTSGTLSTETDYGGEGDNMEGDSTLTLVEEEEEKGKYKVRTVVVDDKDESRYSVTDYFKKYPMNLQNVTADGGAGSKEMSNKVSGSKVKDKTVQGHVVTKTTSVERSTKNKLFEEKPFSPMSFVSTTLSESPAELTDLSNLSFSLTSSSGIPSREDSPAQGNATTTTTTTPQGNPPPPRRENPEKHGGIPPLGQDQAQSPQDHLYKGTELDTSLSTIQEAETNSVLTASTLTTLSSLTSVDEIDFKNGLAKLDANIARIQESLKHSTRSSR